MKFLLIASLAAFLSLESQGEELAVPPLAETIELFKQKLPGVSAEALDKAAVRGLIKELGPRVRVLTNQVAAGEAKAGGVTKKELHEGFAYLRVSEVSPNLDKEFKEAWTSLAGTNKVRGLVLDLRFAGGSDYEAAAKTADQLVGSSEQMLQVGEKTFRGESSTDEIDVPSAILVNKETQGAAEAIAGVLRAEKAGIIIGENTAGQARVYEQVKLSTGLELMLGTSAVKIGGLGTIGEGGLAPDIRVDVSMEEQRAWYEDPYKNMSRVFGSGTNVASNVSTNRRRAFNEAELVRRHREGGVGGTNAVLEPTGAAVIMDPVLARALDFLKGVTTLRGLRD